MQNKNKISTIIVFKDEFEFLSDAIVSLNNFSDELVLITLKPITPKLEKISHLFKKEVKIITNWVNKSIPFADTIKEDAKTFATYNYLLYLDPDEMLSPQLKDYLLERLGQFDYFSIPRKNIIFGKWIKYSRWWPDYQVRLYKKTSVRWPSTLHPIPKLRGKGHIIPPKEKLSIIHHNYKDLDQFLLKAKRYAKNDKKYQKLSDKELIKTSLSELMSRFYLSDGYKDGIRGFDLSLLQMFYYFLVLFYKHEKEDYSKIEDPHDLLLFFFQNGLKDLLFWQGKKINTTRSRKIKRKILLKLLNVLN